MLRIALQSLLLATVAGTRAASWTALVSPPDSLAAGLDSIFAPYNTRTTPGCAVAVGRDGRVILERGYGMASLEHHVPIAPTTVFDIGSVSKQFTALSVLMLAEEGKLDLSDDVRTYLPELPATRPAVTIRHLLNQTSGLRDYVDLFPFAGVQYAAVVTSRDALTLLARQRGVNFAAGSEWGYSNTNYFLLSQVVERVSGRRLGEFLKQRIFEPLGMHATQLWERHGQVVADRAQSYASSPDGIETVAYNWETTGDGAIQSTVGDMMRWLQNLDSARVGGRNLIDQLQQRAVVNSGDSVNYGMGLLVGTWRGLRRIGHNGAAAGFRADIVRFPDQRLAIATLCNNGDVNPTLVNLGIAKLALGRELLPAPPTPSGPGGSSGGPQDARDREAARFAGTYFSPATGLTRTVRVEDGHLMLEGGGPPAELTSLGDGLFQATGTPLKIRLDGGTRGEALKLVELPPPGYLPASYGRVADTVHLSPAALRDYAGVYASGDLGARASWTISVHGGALVLRLPGQAVPDDTLHQDFADGFSSQAAPLRFVRNGHGHVTGFRIWSRAVRGLLLEKRLG